MSRSRSESTVRRRAVRAIRVALRPADHADGAAPTTSSQPALGFVGWLRWGWRQLTSMRTALVLLLLLAIAAVPGSIVPQRSADPNGVTQYFADNPDLAPILDNLQLFDVYTSAWFSAIYILLFVSLIGCVIPRTKHHWKALRARPPRTPARLEPARRPPRVDRRAGATDADAAAARRSIAVARRPQQQLQARRLPRRAVRRARRPCRSRPSAATCARRATSSSTRRSSACCSPSASAADSPTRARASSSRARTFVNTMLDYSSFNPGRFVDEERLDAVLADARRLRRHVPAVRRAGRRAGGRLRRAPDHAVRRARSRSRARCGSTTRSTSPATAST